jgi:hypothetical protein
MPDLTAKRTLVKSPPELWSELSEVERLARHLGAFGEIKITKLEPEHTVAWEGESASGTVSIEPSGWGTKVTLTARVEEGAAEPEAAAPHAPEPEPAKGPEKGAAKEVEPEPVAEPEPQAIEPPPDDAPEPAPKRGFFARLFSRRKAEAVAAEPAVVEEAPAVEDAAAVDDAPAVQRAPVDEVREPAQREAEPVAESSPVPEPADGELDSKDPQAVLDEVLDALGSAHHRPFSRG